MTSVYPIRWECPSASSSSGLVPVAWIVPEGWQSCATQDDVSLYLVVVDLTPPAPSSEAPPPAPPPPTS